jgi:hypothetical protein
MPEAWPSSRTKRTRDELGDGEQHRGSDVVDAMRERASSATAKRAKLTRISRQVVSTP